MHVRMKLFKTPRGKAAAVTKASRLYYSPGTLSDMLISALRAVVGLIGLAVAGVARQVQRFRWR